MMNHWREGEYEDPSGEKFKIRFRLSKIPDIVEVWFREGPIFESPISRLDRLSRIYARQAPLGSYSGSTSPDIEHFLCPSCQREILSSDIPEHSCFQEKDLNETFLEKRPRKYSQEGEDPRPMDFDYLNQREKDLLNDRHNEPPPARNLEFMLVKPPSTLDSSQLGRWRGIQVFISQRKSNLFRDIIIHAI
jgi:hypothetical protein